MAKKIMANEQIMVVNARFMPFSRNILAPLKNPFFTWAPPSPVSVLNTPALWYIRSSCQGWLGLELNASCEMQRSCCFPKDDMSVNSSICTTVDLYLGLTAKPLVFFQATG
jgi:hypothetical protein